MRQLIGSERTPGARVPWWLRAFLLANVVQDVGLGTSGWLTPGHVLVPLKGLTPLNARFVATLYLAGGVVILVAALSKRLMDTRVALMCLLVITMLVLAMTIAYWDRFTVDRVPWLWMTTYCLDPPVTALVLYRFGLLAPAAPGRHPRTGLFLVEALVLGGTGALLLVAPSWFLDAWPWTLTPLLSRVYAAFLCSFALGAALAAFERRAPVQLGIAAGSLTGVALSAAASVVHLSRLDTGGPRWVWFCVHVLAALAMLWTTVTVAGGARRAEPRVVTAG